MSAEDLEKYETEMELHLYREYRDVVGIFKYVVETDRRFYLCNQVDVKARTEAGDVFFEVSMTDAWVWDMYRPARFAKNVKVLTFKDVNVEELSPAEIELAEDLILAFCISPAEPRHGRAPGPSPLQERGGRAADLFRGSVEWWGGAGGPLEGPPVPPLLCLRRIGQESSPGRRGPASSTAAGADPR